MNSWHLFYSFLKDRRVLLAAFLANSFILILFYSLFFGQSDILYPLLLSLFILFTAMGWEWSKYRGFNQEIQNMKTNPGYQLTIKNDEQQRMKDALEEIHSHYLHQINALQLESKEMRRLISQFIHSMKTPSTVIDMAIQEYRDVIDRLDPEDDVYSSCTPIVEDIANENTRMLEMLENVLSLLRLDEFSTDYSPAPVNLEPYLRKLVSSRKSSFIYGNVLPRIDVQCQDPIILTDEKWNGILLDQLISNGIKYSNATSGMKNLYFTITQEGSSITLSIRDEGLGIPEYDLPRVQEAFFTGENGRKVKNSTGIGLYIAYSIAKKLGHTLKILSKPGEGTEVKISYLSKM